MESTLRSIVVLLVDQLKDHLAGLHIQGVEAAVLDLVVQDLVGDADQDARRPRDVHAALVGIIEDVRAAARVLGVHAPVVVQSSGCCSGGTSSASILLGTGLGHKLVEAGHLEQLLLQLLGRVRQQVDGIVAAAIQAGVQGKPRSNGPTKGRIEY